MSEAVTMEPACSLLCRLQGDKPGLQEDQTKTAEWMRELRQAHEEWTIVVNPTPPSPTPSSSCRAVPGCSTCACRREPSRRVGRTGTARRLSPADPLHH